MIDGKRFLQRLQMASRSAALDDVVHHKLPRLEHLWCTTMLNVFGLPLPIPQPHAGALAVLIYEDDASIL